MIIWSAPALTNGSNRISGLEHIRCTSKKSFVHGRIAFTSAGPKEMFGTKWPSMMSRCSQSAPDRSTRRASSAQRLKSDARNEGAIIMGARIEDGGWRMEEGNNRSARGRICPQITQKWEERKE